MRCSFSHRYQQFQSQFQLGAISFFDDRSRVGAGRVPHFWPVLPEVGISFDFSVALSHCATAVPVTSLPPSRCRTQDSASSYPLLRHKYSAVRG